MDSMAYENKFKVNVKDIELTRTLNKEDVVAYNYVIYLEFVSDDKTTETQDSGTIKLEVEGDSYNVGFLRINKVIDVDSAVNILNSGT